VIEKPFGLDLSSARELNARIHAYFDERQVYRIDHYLGKETVQNLFTFRFTNPIFESLWNRDRIDHVQITVAETIGVEGRRDYYDHVGALRDMVQNHLTQLLTLVAMEPPAAFEPEAIRNEKVKVLRSAVPVRREDVFFGQYERGRIEGSEVPGYGEEIDAPSRTETFVALRLEVANWRWQGVPFYLRTGKRMERPLSQVVVRFRAAPVVLFGPGCRAESNVLVITIQPDEGFDLYFSVKSPGQPIRFTTERLHFGTRRRSVPFRRRMRRSSWTSFSGIRRCSSGRMRWKRRGGSMRPCSWIGRRSTPIVPVRGGLRRPTRSSGAKAGVGFRREAGGPGVSRSGGAGRGGCPGHRRVRAGYGRSIWPRHGGPRGRAHAEAAVPAPGGGTDPLGGGAPLLGR
jgi:hypothetical protein